jgi:hypothetical protein
VSLSQLPSGRWRAQVYDPATGKNVSVSNVLGGPGTFPTQAEAADARADAREALRRVNSEGIDRRVRDLTATITYTVPLSRREVGELAEHLGIEPDNDFEGELAEYVKDHASEFIGPGTPMDVDVS